MTKVEKDRNRLDQRTNLLAKRIEHINTENETLRETILQLEVNSSPLYLLYATLMIFYVEYSIKWTRFDHNSTQQYKGEIMGWIFAN